MSTRPSKRLLFATSNWLGADSGPRVDVLFVRVFATAALCLFEVFYFSQREPFFLQCLVVVRGGWAEVTLWAALDSQTAKVSDAHCFDCDH